MRVADDFALDHVASQIDSLPDGAPSCRMSGLAFSTAPDSTAVAVESSFLINGSRQEAGRTSRVTAGRSSDRVHRYFDPLQGASVPPPPPSTASLPRKHVWSFQGAETLCSAITKPRGHLACREAVSGRVSLSPPMSAGDARSRSQRYCAEPLVG